jgi:hypothetical protein
MATKRNSLRNLAFERKAIGIAIVVLLVLPACVVEERRPGPVIEREQRGGGPPPWAPAHGYRAKHAYRYYPATGVYFDPSINRYFYYRDGSWQVSVSLPSTIRIEGDDYVHLELETDKPYLYHDEHRKKFPGKRHGRPF